MTVADLAAEQDRIDALAAETYLDPTGQAEIIWDGVVDPETYLAAPLRIMWFLKEPYCDGNNGGGGWSLIHDHIRAKPPTQLGHHTFHPIIYLTHALLTGQHDWEKIPCVADMPEQAKKAMHSIAFINAKKLPGVTCGVPGDVVRYWFNKGREVIDRQIKAFNPQIIFGCQPHIGQIFQEAGLSPGHGITTVGTADYALVDGRLYVHVYHPGARVDKRTYFEDALRAAVEGLKISLPQFNPAQPIPPTVRQASPSG
jgi:hypothetical protein